MKWEITRKHKPQGGDTRFVTKFAWLPMRVLSKLTMTDHKIWFELYIEEQEYHQKFYHDGRKMVGWKAISKTIHK